MFLAVWLLPTTVRALVTPAVRITPTPSPTPVGGRCVRPPAGLAAWWPLDGNTVEIMGGYHGNALNGPVFGPGLVGGSLSFDGADDQVRVPDVAALDAGSGDFALAAWIKTSAPNPLQVFIDKRTLDQGYTSVRGYEFLLYQGRLSVQLADGGYTNYNSPATAPILNDGRWHFVAVTVDRDHAQGLKLYSDGALVATFDPRGHAGDLSNPADLLFGATHDATLSTPFAGSLDEVDLYKRALTEREIRALYHAGSAGKCRGTIPTTTPGYPPTETPSVPTETPAEHLPTETPYSPTDFPTHVPFPTSTPSGPTNTPYWTPTPTSYPTHVPYPTTTPTPATPIVTMPPGGEQCIPAPDQLTAWWPLDTSAAELVADHHSRVINHGVFEPGMVQRSLHVDGSYGHVRALDSETLDAGTHDFSLAAWIRADDIGRMQVFIDKRELSPVVRGYEFLLYQGRLAVQLADGTHTNYTSPASAPILTDGNWHFVAMTVDRDHAQGLKLYSDGALVATFDPRGHAGSLSNAADLVLGITHDSAFDVAFAGSLDEVDLYKRALTQAEIQALYQAGSAGKCRPHPNEPTPTLPPTDTPETPPTETIPTLPAKSSLRTAQPTVSGETR